MSKIILEASSRKGDLQEDKKKEGGENGEGEEEEGEGKQLLGLISFLSREMFRGMNELWEGMSSRLSR